MPELEILRRLIREANVQVNVMASLCHCAPSTIINYVRGTSLPSGAKIMAIKEGLIKYKEMINEIIKE